jgi:signal transduction histidine kinase
MLASHELRTPLTVLHGYTEAWAAGLLRAPEVEARARVAVRRMVDRMVTLVGEMVEALRIAEHGVDLRPQRLDLASVASAVCEDLRAFSDARAQSMEVVAPAPVMAEADPARLEMVLTNLVQNAIKFTPDGGRIVVTVRESGDGAVVEIDDSGVGIEPGEVERIFERFYTGADLASHQSGAFSFLGRGPGLGLAIARSYVEAHGGRVRAYSDGRGQGSRFTVTLPLVQS